VKYLISLLALTMALGCDSTDSGNTGGSGGAGGQDFSANPPLVIGGDERPSEVGLVPPLEGAETDKVAYSTGCDEGIDAGLWTINEGSHIPSFSTDFADMATDWLFRHTR
jgi:hypothetical protein